MLLDLDNFKAVNDTFGHHVGDLLLVTIAEQLLKTVRLGDIVARLGGDEFAILLNDIKHLSEADQFAKNLIARFNKPFKIEHYFLQMTASVGIAIAPQSGENGYSILKNADMALYAVKELGRNNFMFFNEEINFKFQRQAELEAGLIKAMERQEFYLVFQPQYEFPERKIIGVEALARWQHEVLGAIAPQEFIPICEKNGSIVILGNWILQDACVHYMKWFKLGLLAPDFKLAVNVSPKQIEQDSFVSSLQKILKETGMPPQNLVLELTETAVMTNIIYLDATLDEINNLGVQISIDDFGTSYSSLTRLKNLPISSLKIDTSFLASLSKDPENLAIIKCIIALGESLRLDVISEGVETKEQLDLLLENHCTLFQGFYFGKKPLRGNELVKLLSKK